MKKYEFFYALAGVVLVISGLRYVLPDTLAYFHLIPPVEPWYLPVGFALMMVGVLWLDHWLGGSR